MHPSGSYIKTAIETIRRLINEATFDAKYDDSYIARALLPDAMVDVLSRLNLGADNQVFVRIQIPLVKDKEYYILPPHVMQVMRLCKRNSSGQVEWDFKPRGVFNPAGEGWRIDGNTLKLTPYPQQDETIDLYYIPSGSAGMHYDEQGAVETLTAPTEFSFNSTVALGYLAKEENAYAGYVLRVLSGNTYAERTIASYDTVTRKATLRNPLPDMPTLTGLKYEVVPAGSLPLWKPMSTYAAFEMGVARKAPQTVMFGLTKVLGTAMKTVRDNLFNMQGRVPKHIDRDTIDNPNTALVFDRAFATQ